MKIKILACALLLCATTAAAQDEKKEKDPKDEVILRLRKSLTEATAELIQLRYERAIMSLRAQMRQILAELGEPEPEELKQAEALKPEAVPSAIKK